MDEDLDGPPSARAWSGASVGDLPAGEPRGPVEQRGREATRTRTDINRDTVGDRHTERVERVRQLHVTTKTLLSGDSQRRVGTNAGRRIGHHSAVDEYTTTLDDVRRHVT